MPGFARWHDASRVSFTSGTIRRTLPRHAAPRGIIMSRSLGAILYRGPSLFDGSEIVVIATTNSRNTKTANMVQTWILRVDVAPHDAVRAGRDASICGDCIYAGGNGCYVRTYQAPLSVWRAYHRGRYDDRAGDLAAIASVGDGRTVRLGAYGDPVAVPEEIWSALVSRSAAHTGYTHAWRVAPRAFRSLVMASCDTESDRTVANLRGYRTFRVRDGADAARLRGEMTCPASAEAGHVRSCASCHACDGTRGEGLTQRDVTIDLHGALASRARRAIAAKRAREMHA